MFTSALSVADKKVSFCAKLRRLRTVYVWYRVVKRPLIEARLELIEGEWRCQHAHCLEALIRQEVLSSICQISNILKPHALSVNPTIESLFIANTQFFLNL
jgi:hypothetical protein